MDRARIEVADDHVTCRTLRHWLRATTSDEGLVVEIASRPDMAWVRVDGDLIALTRAITRLVSVDASAAREVTRCAVAMAGIPPRDLHPVNGLIRATYPLLASPEPWPLAPIPPTLRSPLVPVFRAPTAALAARMAFGERATRPVVRAMSELLAVGDLFQFTLAMAAAAVLEPDHLVTVLSHRAVTSETRALQDWELHNLADLLRRQTNRRRVVRALTEAASDTESRRRVRFVAGHADFTLRLDLTRSWADLAFDVAFSANNGIGFVA